MQRLLDFTGVKLNPSLTCVDYMFNACYTQWDSDQFMTRETHVESMLFRPKQRPVTGNRHMVVGRLGFDVDLYKTRSATLLIPLYAKRYVEAFSSLNGQPCPDVHLDRPTIVSAS